MSTVTPGKRVQDVVETKPQLFIDGARVDAKSNKTFETLNPATGETLATVAVEATRKRTFRIGAALRTAATIAVVLLVPAACGSPGPSGASGGAAISARRLGVRVGSFQHAADAPADARARARAAQPGGHDPCLTRSPATTPAARYWRTRNSSVVGTTASGPTPSLVNFAGRGSRADTPCR